MLIRSIKQKLQSSGFDLCHPIHTVWYNRLIQNEGLVDSGALKILPEPSPSISQDNDDTYDEMRGVVLSYNAVLIGNTKTVWPSFIDWLVMKVEEKKTRQDILVSNDERKIIQHHDTALDDVIQSSPFDTYCEESLSKSLQELCSTEDQRNKIASYELFWSNGKRQKFSTNHSPNDEEKDDMPQNNNMQAKQQYHCFDKNQDSFLVSMQRIASASGQYWHDEENTKLCVHPVYGTWTAFRALVVFEMDTSFIIHANNDSSSIPSQPSPCPCPLSEEEMKEAKKIFDYALELNTSGQGNNAGSYGTQANKTWDELCTYLHNQVCKGSDWDEVPDSMKPWIELRNAIRVGRNEWKYDEPQLLYHYTKDPNILRREVERRLMQRQRI